MSEPKLKPVAGKSIQLSSTVSRELLELPPIHSQGAHWQEADIEAYPGLKPMHLHVCMLQRSQGLTAIANSSSPIHVWLNAPGKKQY